jgi:hypothetical protein
VLPEQAENRGVCRGSHQEQAEGDADKDPHFPSTDES